MGGTQFDLAGSEYIVIPGGPVSLTLLVVVSLLTKPSPKDKWAPFFMGSGAASAEQPG